MTVDAIGIIVSILIPFGVFSFWFGKTITSVERSQRRIFKGLEVINKKIDRRHKAALEYTDHELAKAEKKIEALLKAEKDLILKAIKKAS